MPEKFIRRVVNLEERDYSIVKRFAKEKGLGGKGFSAALRFIVREWEQLSRRFDLEPDDTTPPQSPSDS